MFRVTRNYYRPQTKFAKVMFLQVSVILSMGGACVVAPGGRAWLLPGGCMVAGGGMRGCSQGGMCGCSRGGMRGFFDEIRSMSGRYASYWNASLFYRSFIRYYHVIPFYYVSLGVLANIIDFHNFGSLLLL